MTVAEIVSDGCQKMGHLCKVHSHLAPEGRISGVNKGMASIARAPNIVEASLGVRNIPPALSSERAVVVRE
ncbi:hypothetical protein E3E36_03095 [Thermococcus sp. M36]|uniref:hypothetical protein n=1 Tax=Thermococcus sp. M36 TaxID=1638261 RepID=UPI00143AE75D|nr:hypothetical protein [Thermococcus sp. M36]NJE05144.1 hypothetical protein [Thermococcus sp. M36]